MVTAGCTPGGIGGGLWDTRMRREDASRSELSRGPTSLGVGSGGGYDRRLDDIPRRQGCGGSKKEPPRVQDDRISFAEHSVRERVTGETGAKEIRVAFGTGGISGGTVERHWT